MREIKCLTVGHINEILDEIDECSEDIRDVLRSDEDERVKAYYAKARFQGVVQLLNTNILAGDNI